MLRFGTDGVRGRAYTELHPSHAARLAAAAAEATHPATDVVVCRDTRESGPDFVDALVDGFSAHGVRTLDMGVAPTPAAAWASARLQVPAVAVSASHNPWHDNGIKFFAAGGRKPADDEQARLEAALADTAPPPPPAQRLRDDVSHLLDDYLRWLHTSVPPASTPTPNPDRQLHVVVDAAHGAASPLAAPALDVPGVRAEVVNAAPDGRNINHDCGSLHPQVLADQVAARGADCGLALDGDADRVLAVDADGRLVDGDQLIAIFALDMQRRGVLTGDTVAVTVMANLGLHRALARHHIQVVTTPVGDRHVLAALAEGGWSLGGEQSGHIIFTDVATTGDGLLTGLRLIDVMARSGLPLAALADAAMTKLPQVLLNVPDIAAEDQRLQTLAAQAQQTLGQRGRILVRRSGTEPLVRIMVEAETLSEAEATAQQLAATVTATGSTGSLN